MKVLFFNLNSFQNSTFHWTKPPKTAKDDSLWGSKVVAIRLDDKRLPTDSVLVVHQRRVLLFVNAGFVRFWILVFVRVGLRFVLVCRVSDVRQHSTCNTVCVHAVCCVNRSGQQFLSCSVPKQTNSFLLPEGQMPRGK